MNKIAIELVKIAKSLLKTASVEDMKSRLEKLGVDVAWGTSYTGWRISEKGEGLFSIWLEIDMGPVAFSERIWKSKRYVVLLTDSDAEFKKIIARVEREAAPVRRKKRQQDGEFSKSVSQGLGGYWDR